MMATKKNKQRTIIIPPNYRELNYTVIFNDEDCRAAIWFQLGEQWSVTDIYDAICLISEAEPHIKEYIFRPQDVGVSREEYNTFVEKIKADEQYKQDFPEWADPF